MGLKFWKSSSTTADERTPGGKLAHHVTNVRSPGRIGSLEPAHCEALRKLRAEFSEAAAACVPASAAAAFCSAEAEEFAIDSTPATEIDAFLLRFLKACRFELEAARVMLTDFFQWRAAAKVPQIVQDVRFPWIHRVRQLYPHNYFGVDKMGRPIFIDRVGRSDTRHLLKEVALNHLLSYWVQQYEYLRCVIFPACSIRFKRRVDKCVTIVDLAGLKMSHFNSSSRSVLRKLATITQNYYPEMLGAMIVVNAPAVFGPIWTFAKGLLDPATVAKISLLTSRCASWRESLQAVVDTDQLPSFLGGTQPEESWQTRAFGPWADPDVLEAVRHRDTSLPADFVPLALEGSEESLRLLEGSSPVAAPAAAAKESEQSFDKGNNDADECIEDVNIEKE